MSSSTEGVAIILRILSILTKIPYGPLYCLLPPLFNYLKNALSGRFCVRPIYRAAAAFIYEIKDNY